MKKHLLLVAALAAGIAANAQYTQELPLDYEDFFRADAIAEGGAALERGVYTTNTQGSGVIMVDQWNNGGKSSDKDGSSPVLQASTLSYDAYVDNLKGSEIMLANLASGTRASIYSLKENYTYSEKAYYLAALIKITEATGKGDILTFDGNYTANAQRGRLFVNKQGSGYKLGVGWNGDPETWTDELAFGSTHLVVMKIIPAGSASGTTESIFAWVDPDLSKDEANNTAITSLTEQTTGLKSVRGITVRQRAKIAGSIAGLRFGESWAEVVKKAVAGLPALDAPVLGEASAISAEGFTANWTAVANATGYKVRVYNGDAEIAEKTVDGQASASVVIGNMPPATSLTYTVAALGDGLTYDNSAESAKSAAFQTLAAPAALVFLPSADVWTEYSSDKDAYISGSFPNFSANGYDFAAAYIEISKDEEGKSFSGTLAATGERYIARVKIDKSSNGGLFTMPAVASAARVDLYVSSGSDSKKIKVQQFNYATSAWEDLVELDVNKALSVHQVTPKAGIVKLRIASSDSSGKQVWKVVTFASAPATLDVPVAAEATTVTDSCFTANWAAVSGAAGYRVIVYGAEDAVVQRAIVDAAATSLVVKDLTAATTYTYKVAAIGDDANTVDSNLSEAISVTTAASTPTALDLNTVTDKAQKVLINGQLFIRVNGALMSVTGAKIQ
ncbi:MAG: fibronectin type III domain-containing protein [Paludibacteraceae bacterium]|nr:fibronectin type III domain-containing protein [Paludibacteraceae bacterium]